MGMDKPIGEGYKINITLGFLITFVSALCSVVAIGAVMRSDILRALSVIESQQKTILEMQLQLNENANDIKNFRQQYERDFNKYIR